jgi:hypothetical protein|tara:strand:+ start:580 stop:765 length:186 start_codon:yes stop_codon:yes gene_type:complete
MSESFGMGMEAVHKRMEWDRAVAEVQEAVEFRLEAMTMRYSHCTEEERERLAQAWARILQG